MKQKAKRIALVLIGVLFVLLGLIGFALPFLQGFLFLAIGLMLLSISSARMRTWLESHTRRYPKLHALVGRIERWALDIIGPVE